LLVLQVEVADMMLVVLVAVVVMEEQVNLNMLMEQEL